MILISWIVWLINLPFVSLIRLYRKIITRRRDNYKVREAGSGMKGPTLMIQDRINKFYELVNKLSHVEVKIKLVEGEGETADALAEKKDDDYIFKDTYLDELAENLYAILIIAVKHNIKIPGYYSFMIHMTEVDESVVHPSFPYIDRAVNDFINGYGPLVRFFSSGYGKNIKERLIEKIKEKDRRYSRTRPTYQ